MKKWGITILIIALVAALYFIEFSKIEGNNETTNAMPTLDNLQFDETAKSWAEFYKVRATIIDGQNAEIEIPKKLRESVGKEMKLSGAAVFFSPGCRVVGDKIAVRSMFLYPTLGLANACSHLPEIAMRWTIRINLKEDWLITNTDMINAEAEVRGIFRMNTDKPYESVFFLDSAQVELIHKKEEQL